MAKPISIEYSYKFKNGLNKKFIINLDRDTLALQGERNPTPPL